MTAIYLKRDDKLLLLYRQGSHVVNDVWIGSAGGHLEESELNDARACVLRELEEELSITEEQICNLQLRYVTLRRTKGEIRQNYYFFADLKEDGSPEISSNEGILRWFTLDELSDLPMPFSARYMMDHYLSEGIYNEKMYGGIADGEKVVFTEMPDF